MGSLSASLSDTLFRCGVGDANDTYGHHPEFLREAADAIAFRPTPKKVALIVSLVEEKAKSRLRRRQVYARSSRSDYDSAGSTMSGLCHGVSSCIFRALRGCGKRNMSRKLMPIARKLVQYGVDAIGMPASKNTPKKFAPNEGDEFKWISSAGIGTVLDIGAHAGESSQQMRSILPDATIYAFEPLPDPCARLISLMGADNNFSAFQFALGDKNERVQMQENDFTQSSSILPMADRHREEFPFTVKTEPKEVEVRRLDDVASDLSLRDNVLIKVDVQGFEDRVIRGGSETIKKAAIVIIEVSFVRLYEKQPLFSTIYDHLRALGFSYGGQWRELKSPSNGRPLQADAFFLKD